MLLFTFVFGLVAAPDLSMSPAVKAGDLVLYYRLESSLKVSDVVIVNVEGEKQIRRVAAIAGDEVDISENGLKVNGYIQQESEISGQTIRFEKGVDFPLTVKEDEIFVLCDQREDAGDSRIYGPVSIEDVSGIIIAVLRQKNI